MAAVAFDALAEPVSDSEPCGPDLDLAGDAEYMNFIAKAEGLLPATYFSGPEGRPFDRMSVDFAAEFAAAAPIIARTRDLRLLGIVVKLLILNRDLPGFVAGIDTIAKLLEERWDDVHPQAMDGDFGIRTAALESLDDMPHVIFPLQYAPLLTHRRLGPLAYRSWMIATGETKPRDGEDIHDATVLDRALMDEELSALVETRSRIELLHSALQRIGAIYLDRAGGQAAVKLERLPALTAKMLALLDGVVTRRDPSLASAISPQAADGAQGAGESTISAGAVASKRDAAAALAAIADYFSRFEPSSPALLLVRQAADLMGKSFLDAMRVLMPAQVEQASVKIGRDQQFDLPIERLSAFATVPDAEQESEPDPNVSAEPAPEADASAESTEPGEGAEATNAGEQAAPEPAVASAPSRLVARTRADAIRLLEQVGTYYRVAEPSSPIPFLTERARSFAERDFLSLVKELLPQDAFKSGGTESPTS